MKRKIGIVLPLVALLFIFASCGQTTAEVTPSTPPAAELDEVVSPVYAAPESVLSPEPTPVEISVTDTVAPVESVDTEGLSLYWQAENLQFASDAEAKLSLYVDASKDENGEYIFDDGQEWLLLLETSLGYYELFPRAYVQLGDVNCTAFNDADGIFHVLVTDNAGAGHRIYDCVFDDAGAGMQHFLITEIYEQSGINRTAYSE